MRRRRATSKDSPAATGVTRTSKKRESVFRNGDDRCFDTARVGVSTQRESVLGNYRYFETTLPRGVRNSATAQTEQPRGAGSVETPSFSRHRLSLRRKHRSSSVSKHRSSGSFETPIIAVSLSPVIGRRVRLRRRAARQAASPSSPLRGAPRRRRLHSAR